MFGEFDIVIVSVLLLTLLGAVSYYFYGRVVYLEKKIGFLQNIVVELKQNAWQGAAGAIPPEWQKLIETTGVAPPEMATVPSPMEGVVFESAEPLKQEEVETLPGEEYYSNVLDAAGAVAESMVETETVEQDQAPNYEAMSKQELTGLVKQRGLKVSKTAKITELISILRRDDEMKRQTEPAPAAAPSTLESAEITENNLVAE